jgi:hypothetical protein
MEVSQGMGGTSKNNPLFLIFNHKPSSYRPHYGSPIFFYRLISGNPEELHQGFIRRDGFTPQKAGGHVPWSATRIGAVITRVLQKNNGVVITLVK